MLRPYIIGSTAWPTNSSITMYSAAVQIAIDQPGSTAAASAIGSPAAMNEPIYGTKRSSADSIPQSTGFGTPIKYRPTPITKPKVALMPSWVRKYLLSRRAPSSRAEVVRCRSVAPKSRISRSRRSSRCSRMKIVTTKTMPMVANGKSAGER